MRKRYKIWEKIFFIVFGLSIVNYILRVIPNFNEILNSDEQFWNIASSGEKIQRIGYYFGYLFPISIVIFWLIQKYFKPKNVLKRKGYKQDVENLKELLSSKSISREEYDAKLDKIEQISLDKELNNKSEIITKQSEQKLNQEYKTLIELKEKGILTKEEFESKEAVIQLEKNDNQYDAEIIERLIKKYDFENQDTEEFLKETFIPKMQERSVNELLTVLKSDGYKPSAKYQAYIEIKTRKING